MAFIPTLLKYEFAVEAAAHPLEKYKENHEDQNFEDMFQMCKGVNMKPPEYFNKDLELNSQEKEKEENRLHEILNFMFPPRQFFDNGKDWIQFISKYLSNSFDLKGLDGELSRMLMVRSARKKGLCRIRRQIYDQLMNELIRQITIECIDRGTLLNRIKKEMDHMFETYQILLDASEGFLARKCLEAKNQYNDRLIKTNALIAEKRNLEKQVSDLKMRVDHIERRNQDLLKKQESKNGEQINFFKQLIQQYKSYIDAVMTGSQMLGS